MNAISEPGAPVVFRMWFSYRDRLSMFVGSKHRAGCSKRSLRALAMRRHTLAVLISAPVARAAFALWAGYSEHDLAFVLVHHIPLRGAAAWVRLRLKHPLPSVTHHQLPIC